ncbi:MAG: 50S ribosomal protein L5 [Candidatus Syntropharchaeia archaeon]
MEENHMREVRLDKVVVNMGVGESGQRLINAERVLETVTGQKPVRTISKKTRQPFGIKKGEPIGCKVTLRGERGEEFLKKAFKINQNAMSLYGFDESGSFSFGIEEHTDFPGMSYDPEVGIFGMDVSVTLCRPGYRIKRRKVGRKKIPNSHRVKREDAIRFVQEKFGVRIVE